MIQPTKENLVSLNILVVEYVDERGVMTYACEFVFKLNTGDYLFYKWDAMSPYEVAEEVNEMVDCGDWPDIEYKTDHVWVPCRRPDGKRDLRRVDKKLDLRAVGCVAGEVLV